MSGQTIRFGAADVTPPPGQEPTVNIVPGPAAGRGTGGAFGAAGLMSGADNLLTLLKSIAQPENWPAIGGAVGGGAVGMAGGLPTLGLGAVPGGIAGATVGGGAGEAARQLYERFFGSGEGPATSLDAAADIGLQGAVQGGLEAAGGALTKGAGMAAEGLYRGFLKPSLSKIGKAKARQIVRTALEEGLPIAEAGTRKANSLITQLNAEVNAILSNSGGRVDLHQVAEQVRAWGKKRYYGPGADPADYEAVLKVADSIDQHPALGLPAGAVPTRVDVPMTAANQTKQRLGERVPFGTESAPKTGAKKAGYYATRKAMERVEPDIADKTLRESRIIDARDAVQAGAEREANRNAMFGVPTLMSGAIGGAVGAQQGDPVSGIITGLLARGAMTPAVASRVAILASKFAKVPGTLPADAVRLAVAVIERESGGQAPDE